MRFIRSLLRLKAVDKSGYEEEAFNYQLETLKIELDLINQAFDRIDHMTQAIKNWSVVVWGGSIAVLLGVPELRQFVVLTGLVVLPFWISEGRWRSYIKRFINRQNKISDFLNSEDFIQSFKAKRWSTSQSPLTAEPGMKRDTFIVLDPFSRQDFEKEEKDKKTKNDEEKKKRDGEKSEGEVENEKKKEKRKPNTFRSMLSAEVSYFYVGMILISAAVGLFFLLAT
ncbi:MAG: hypothetical protein JXA14_25160 [Anaerolineae bacterium]|nr:hypothetical protein [Anaerolineae bacterium]